jgi:hypothetical protein
MSLNGFVIVRIQFVYCMVTIFCLWGSTTSAVDSAKIRERSALRHLGIIYANFVMERDDRVEGLDVDLMRLFAKRL